MKSNPLHIVLTGGGTGGHLFPGLATAEQLVARLPHTRITFVGSGKSFERRHVAAAGFEYLALPCRPLPGRVREVFSCMVENFAGYLAGRRFLAEEHVAAVVGLGGYASVPMARAAAKQGLPLVLLEQNAVPGKATRWLARSAALVCTAWPPSGWKLRCPVRVTGNPIRPGFQRRHGGKRLIVLGGSGGAMSLNENVPRALYKIRSQLAPWQIVHQSGNAGLESTAALYGKLDLEATVAPFVANMPALLATAEMAVCRAGGTTLAELAAAGVPAVLVPYPHAAADHQRRNAEVFAKAGGAIMVDPREPAGRLDDRLAAVMSKLLDGPDKRVRMSDLMRRFARVDAAAEVAAVILDVVRPHCPATLPAAA